MASPTDGNWKYKLHYFEVRGRAEIIRLLFNYAGVEFEDYRFSIPDWINRSKDIPFHLYESGKVPLLEITNEQGKTYRLFQSVAIARYLANRFNLTGANAIESAFCDEIVDALQEPYNICVPAYYDSDEQKRVAVHEALKTQHYPRVLGYLERRLKANGGQHMVGDQLTWADFAVCWIIRSLQDYARPIAGEIDANYPQLVKLAEKIEKIPSIAAYMASNKRPATDR